jgi:hypothetical protein
MTDPILNGTNHAADRRLIDDVMAADPFDGGCAHDCADRHVTRGLTEADLSAADRHVIAMCESAFELGWLRCYRKAQAIVADLPIDPSAKTTVLLAIMGLPGKPSTEAAKAYRRDQVEMHLRIASGA